TLGIILFFAFISHNSLAQNENIEKSIITDESIKTITEFQEVLNMLAYIPLSDFERGFIIKNSYTENMNQIFLNDDD
ncbi:MAG: hypothetical protein AAGA80_27235, partial [Cyanobacteria bacterium P01_F01_bin.143]